ncbi:hypothetical protein GIB67_016920 [Kingdonia uniflora]|uniref:Uncharacterized protein n=1 Tax=Kingdonia uniflora TaxID=39325 RepID=A0A7J7M3F6_9MAGN|nr:hypothetical protein GIB67_016920 [Kingdonia uniflora]
MGRRPCCSKDGLNRGAWTALEDRTLEEYIQIHGQGSWRNLPIEAGQYYIHATIEDLFLVFEINVLWSLIAGRLPGRTDNEIKNYWNTNLSKKVQSHSTSKRTHKESTLSMEKRILNNPTPSARLPPPVPTTESRVVRTKATRCTKVFFTPELAPESDGLLSDFMDDLDVGGLCLSEFLHSDFSDLCRFDDNNTIRLDGNIDNTNDLSPPPISSDNPLLFHGENIEQYWTGVNCIQRDATSDLQSLDTFLNAKEDW